MRPFVKGALGMVVLTVFAAAVLAAVDEKPVDAAQASAQSWLAFVDAARYGESWEQASSTFKGAVSKEQWIRMVSSARGPLGKAQSRKLAAAHLLKDPPGSPAGEYVQLQFATSFEKQPSAVETVAAYLEKDGQWRVAGYWIKPK